MELSKNGRIVYANPAAISLIDRPETKLLGSHFTESFAEDFRKPITNLIETSDKKAGMVAENWPISLNDRLVMLKTLPIHESKSTIIILNDITEQKLAAELQSSLNKIRSTLNGTIQAIAMIVERRDPYTAGHQRRVADLGRAVAEEMGLTEDQIEGVGVSGVIHDIGKIAVPAEILSKPGALDPEEFLLIKKHPQVGYDILRGIEFPWPIAEIVLQHHERRNGSGYPQGLSGEEILVEARILCVSDVVEAMASHRPYRAALGIHKASEEIEQKRGIAYDTDVVEACSRVLREKGFEFR